jgi:hypothetical protein
MTLRTADLDRVGVVLGTDNEDETVDATMSEDTLTLKSDGFSSISAAVGTATRGVDITF